jgi:hypothetical protein
MLIVPYAKLEESYQRFFANLCGCGQIEALLLMLFILQEFVENILVVLGFDTGALNIDAFYVASTNILPSHIAPAELQSRTAV